MPPGQRPFDELEQRVQVGAVARHRPVEIGARELRERPEKREVHVRARVDLRAPFHPRDRPVELRAARPWPPPRARRDRHRRSEPDRPRSRRTARTPRRARGSPRDGSPRSRSRSPRNRRRRARTRPAHRGTACRSPPPRSTGSATAEAVERAEQQDATVGEPVRARVLIAGTGVEPERNRYDVSSALRRVTRASRPSSTGGTARQRSAPYAVGRRRRRQRPTPGACRRRIGTRARRAPRSRTRPPIRRSSSSVDHAGGCEHLAPDQCEVRKSPQAHGVDLVRESMAGAADLLGRHASAIASIISGYRR